MVYFSLQFTFTNTEWLEASFQKRECIKVIPSSKDPTRYVDVVTRKPVNSADLLPS